MMLSLEKQIAEVKSMICREAQNFVADLEVLDRFKEIQSNIDRIIYDGDYDEDTRDMVRELVLQRGRNRAELIKLGELYRQLKQLQKW